MKYIITAIGVLLSAATIIPTTLHESLPKAQKIKPIQKVRWISFEQAMKKSKSNPRKIFIDVYTDWCGWCKRMDKNTFQNEKIARILNEKYYAVKFNAEQQEDIVFDGQTFRFVPQGRNGYHELAAALLNNKMSYPTVVFLDEKFQMITPVSGYQKPENLHPILEFIGDDYYKKMDWKTFTKSYKSSF